MAKPFQDCVLLLGDSLTLGQEVPHNLQARFSRRCLLPVRRYKLTTTEVYKRSFDILNRGFGGYNSNWLLAMFDHILARQTEVAHCHDVRLVTLWLGVNDSSYTKEKNKGVSLPQFKANIETMLGHLTSSSSPYAIAHSKVPLSIILISAAPVEESMRNDPTHVNDKSVKQYSDAVVEIGQRWIKNRTDADNWKLGVVDLYSAFTDASKDKGMPHLFTDGVHLSSAGYGVLWAEIEKLVQCELRGRGIDWNDQGDLPWTAPVWSEPAEHGTQRVLELLKSKY